jgi:DNA (cytosine-5)-methyltransferase 1
VKYASVCDGIGAAHVAWQPLGWQCQWTSEIEPFPSAVVEHHYGFRNLGDMTAVTEEMLDGPVELLVGGTPCQSFSVAGLRGGLADPRGNLALRFVQLAAVMQPQWIVWENVPGVLSSAGGRDFGTFLGALGELGYGFAYRVLDAQWFGVPQRRRRVFVVGHLGDWRRAATVLFERESVFGNPPTRGATGQGVAAGPQGIAGNVSSKWAKGTGGPAGDECYNLVAFHHNAQAAQLPHARRDTSVTDSLTCSQGAAVAFDILGTPATNAAKQTDVHVPLRARLPGQSEASTTTVVAFKPGQSEAAGGTFVTEEFSPTLQAQNNGSTAVPAVGFTYSGYSNQPAWMTGDRTDCLPASGHSDGSHQGVGVMALRENQRGEVQYVDPPHALASGGGKPGQGYCGVQQAMAVRRLTPRECERLQGFPDDYTLVEYRKKPAADGPRYRALGNSMAVPVMRWVGERIAMVDKITLKGGAA